MAERTPDANRILVIAGMHRSGTSLTAKWLAHCGLHVGDELLHRPTDNPTGHYEDLSFLQLHATILRDNGLDYLVMDTDMLVFEDRHEAAARALIRDRAGQAQWGWKEPRTALFLDFWKTLLPDMNVLVVYRHFTAVADSLLRRAQKRALHKLNPLRLHQRLETTRKLAFVRRIPGLLWLVSLIEPPLRKLLTRLRYSYWNLPLLRRYLRTWQRYNTDLLAFVDAHPDQALVVNINDLPAQTDAIIAYCNQVWHFDLEPTPIESVFVEGMLTLRKMWFREMLLNILAPACRPLYERLNDQEAATRQKLANRK